MEAKARRDDAERHGMATVPVQGVERIQFYEGHVPVWTTNATAIGLVSADCTDLATKTDSARAAYEAHRAAQETAKAKTLAYHEALRVLGAAGSLAINKIKVKAQSVGGTSVYTLAEI